LSNLTTEVDNFTANLEDKIPYTGATDDVDLGTHSVTAN